MERILSARLGHILVRTDTRRLKSLARQLFVFIRHQMATERELVDVSALPSEIENPDLSTPSVNSKNKFIEKHTLGSGTPRLYLDLGYGLFLQ